MSNEQDKPTGQPAPEESAAPAAASPLTNPDLEVKEVPEMRSFLREYGTPVLVAVGLGAAVFLGISAYKNYKVAAARNASTLLFTARSADQISKVIDQYPSTPSAALAHLMLAADHFDAGRVDVALNVYKQFEQKFPNHPLGDLAAVGQAQCLEALGRVDEALKGFSACVTAAGTNGYLNAVARFGRARCYEQSGKLEEARAEYEDFIAANPDSPWADRAHSALLFVNKQIRAQKKP